MKRSQKIQDPIIPPDVCARLNAVYTLAREEYRRLHPDRTFQMVGDEPYLAPPELRPRLPSDPA